MTKALDIFLMSKMRVFSFPHVAAPFLVRLSNNYSCFQKGMRDTWKQKNARFRPLQIQVISHSILGRLTRKCLRSTLLIDPDVPTPILTRNDIFQKSTLTGAFSVTKQEPRLGLAFGLPDHDGRVRDEVQGCLDGVNSLALAREASILGFLIFSIVFVVIYQTTASAGLGIAGIYLEDHP
jgi:hypothetical protein